MTTGLTGLRLLVVDDEPMVRHVFRRWLVAAGAAVIDVDSVTAACALLSDGQKFDAVVTDYWMPGLSGADLVDWIRKRWPDLPVLLLSGLPQGAERRREIIEKPVKGADLTAAVVDLLSERRATIRVPHRLSRPS